MCLYVVMRGGAFFHGKEFRKLVSRGDREGALAVTTVGLALLL